MTTTATLSALLRQPNTVIRALDEGDVVITRRDGEALRLSKDTNATADQEMVAAFAQLIAATVQDQSVAERIAENLVGPFPWIEFLDEDSRRDFAGEFLRTARACASVGRFDRLAAVVGNWRETAEVLSLGLQHQLNDLDYIPGGVAVSDPRSA
ncbi:MAG: hypothetical protein QM621_04535 [Aeromicrobium sp.]|uniref:hypothetical protein n=1 Tax=Aeromicrobium sp. TaxID=1871063 RepID=UPI0039E6FEE1